MTIGNLFSLKMPRMIKPKNAAKEGITKGILAGAELEIENLMASRGFYEREAGEQWAVVSDGSLRPVDESWEFVSKPMPMAYLMGEIEVLINKLDLQNGNYSDRTSVHLHTNVLDFTQQQLSTLCLVYTCVEEILFDFVNNYNVDKEIYPYGMCRDTNIYCIPWTQGRLNHHLVDRIISRPDEAFGNWQKYSALNLAPVQTQGTVEWRHMHGTNDIEKLTLWFRVIGSLMEFAKSNSFDDVVTALKTLNDVSTYQQFFVSILGGVLPYTDEYRTKLSEGCVNAKYSLIEWSQRRSGKLLIKEDPRNDFRELMGTIDEARTINTILLGLNNNNNRPVPRIPVDHEVEGPYIPGPYDDVTTE